MGLFLKNFFSGFVIGGWVLQTRAPGLFTFLIWDFTLPLDVDLVFLDNKKGLLKSMAYVGRRFRSFTACYMK